MGGSHSPTRAIQIAISLLFWRYVYSTDPFIIRKLNALHFIPRGLFFKTSNVFLQVQYVFRHSGWPCFFLGCFDDCPHYCLEQCLWVRCVVYKYSHQSFVSFNHVDVPLRGHRRSARSMKSINSEKKIHAEMVDSCQNLAQLVWKNCQKAKVRFLKAFPATVHVNEYHTQSWAELFVSLSVVTSFRSCDVTLENILSNLIIFHVFVNL